MFFSNFLILLFIRRCGCFLSFSKPASEVKPGRAGLVRGWVTVREYGCVVGSFFLRLTRPRGDSNRGCAMPFWRPRRGFGCEGNPQSFCFRLQRFTVANQGGHPCVALRVSHEPLLIVTWFFITFRYFAISQDLDSPTIKPHCQSVQSVHFSVSK